MSKNILIVSPALVKERTALHTNTDEKLIYPEIKAAQDIYVLPLLGSALFNAILTDIADNTLAGYRKILVDDYLIDMVCNYVMAELPDGINYQFTNKGVITKSNDNSNPPSMSDMYSIVAKYRNRAEHYEKRALLFLRQNANDHFTEYLVWGSNIDDVRPSNESFSIPIYLGDDCPKYKSFEEKYQGNRPNCC